MIRSLIVTCHIAKGDQPALQYVYTPLYRPLILKLRQFNCKFEEFSLKTSLITIMSSFDTFIFLKGMENDLFLN